MEVNVLTCTIAMEELSASGTVLKRSVHKNLTLTIGRNEFRDVVLKVEFSKKDLKFELKELTIHKKFAKDGKATIKIPDRKLNLMISNCPPDKLIMFLKTLDTKLQCLKLKGFVPERKKLLSGCPRSFEEISPLTIKDLQTVHEARAKTLENKPDLFTPKGKRKRMEGSDKENDPPRGVKLARKMLGGTGPSPGKIIANPIKLSKEQTAVLSAVTGRKNVFFTGSAGTGKSYLLRRIIGRFGICFGRSFTVYTCAWTMNS